jgi:hypothetical protein
VKPASHSLYWKAQKKNYALKSLSWACFITLKALYDAKLPAEFADAAVRNSNTRITKVSLNKHFGISPQQSQCLPISADSKATETNAPLATSKRPREAAEDEESALPLQLPVLGRSRTMADSNAHQEE